MASSSTGVSFSGPRVATGHGEAGRDGRGLSRVFACPGRYGQELARLGQAAKRGRDWHVVRSLRALGSRTKELSMAKIAFIVDEMFEDSEFAMPFEQMKKAGHEPVIVGVEKHKKLHGKKGKQIAADVAVGEVRPSEFAALVIPGGYSPDHLRQSAEMVRFVRDFVESGKPVAAICHAGWMLAEAKVATGRTLTSWPSIKTDLVNAGAKWVDREVVEDENVITSRKPDDLPAFCNALLRQLERGSARRARGTNGGQRAESRTR
jgi:protease I